MKSITLKNKVVGTELEMRIFADTISFFIKPKKHSKYWIPVILEKEEVSLIHQYVIEMSIKPVRK